MDEGGDADAGLAMQVGSDDVDDGGLDLRSSSSRGSSPGPTLTVTPPAGAAAAAPPPMLLQNKREVGNRMILVTTVTTRLHSIKMKIVFHLDFVLFLSRFASAV